MIGHFNSQKLFCVEEYSDSDSILEKQVHMLCIKRLIITVFYPAIIVIF